MPSVCSPFGVVLRKSKPKSIKFLATALGLTLAGVAAAATQPGSGVVRIASDPTSGPGQHATVVEPQAAAVGASIVTVFQAGRFSDGGSETIGFARSSDAGRTWQPGVLPALTSASTPHGPYDRASDAVVAWDARHARWLVAVLALGATSTAVTASSSGDGLTWDPPAVAVTAPRLRNGDTNFDKEWLTCDNGRRSPFFGRCYVVYTDFTLGALAVRSTSDAGVTWSAPVAIPVDSDVPGPQPAVRPSGELVIVFLERGVVESVRSPDGGVTFRPRDRVASTILHRHPFRRDRLRVFPLPTATVDAAGKVYAAWFDCRFQPRCRDDDLVLSTSTSGGRWSAPRRIRLPRSATTDFVLPALGVDTASRGRAARLALTYYTLNAPDCSLERCRLDAWLSTSRNGGLRWSAPRRLNAQRMQLGWLAETVTGRMVGDYLGAVFAAGRAVGIAAIARPPSAAGLDEAVYAGR